MRLSLIALALFVAAGCSEHRVLFSSAVVPLQPPLFLTRGVLEIPNSQQLTPPERPLAADLLVEDLDGDGVGDMVVSTLGGAVEVLLGDGSGGFNPAQSLAVTAFCFNVRAGDLDGDGDLDLAALGSDTGTVHVFRNDGAATFALAAELDVPPLASGLALGDFASPDGDPNCPCNGPPDGLVDLAVSHFGRSVVTTFWGSGDGTFMAGPDLELPAATPPVRPESVGATMVDLNGDGRVEVVVADHGAGRLIAFYNVDGLTMAAIVSDYPVGLGPITVAHGDLDSNGRMDLVVGSREGRSVSVLRQTGIGGAFETSIFDVTDVPLDESVSRVVLAQLVGDPALDLIVCAFDRSSVSVFPGRGDGTFDFGDAAAEVPASGLPFAPVVADLNGDAAPDLAVTGSGTAAVNLYLSDGTGGLRTGYNYGTAHPGPASVTSADFDGDGRAEMVLSGAAFDRIIIAGTPDGAPTDLLQTSTLAEIEVGLPVLLCDRLDIDGDGREDIAASTTRGLKLFINASTQPGELAFTPVPAGLGEVLIAGQGEFQVAAGDLNRDGIGDLVASDPLSGTVLYARGTSSSPLMFDTTSIPLGGEPSGIGVADFNGDGLLDVAVALFDRAEVRFLRGLPDGSLDAQWLSVPVGGGPTYMELADFDRDGLRDVVISNGFSDEITVLNNRTDLSTGAVGFEAALLNCGDVPTGMTTGDLDNDGNIDILVTALRSAEACVFLGTGTGFVPTQRLAATYGATALDFGDADGDGWVDLTIATAQSRRFSIYRNIGFTLEEPSEPGEAQ
ncbi:MAG: VCBS repeat-containing protein [Planctomycetota bacterium]